MPYHKGNTKVIYLAHVNQVWLQESVMEDLWIRWLNLPKRVKVGIVLKVAERIYEHYHYHEISIKIDAIQSHAERELTAETVKELQELIDERREIPVLEINIIHRLKAKQYSSSYEETS